MIHWESIYRIVRGIVLDAAAADQVTHRTFDAAFRSLERGRRPDSARLALHGIAVRSARSHLRRRALLQLLRRRSAPPVETRTLATQALAALSPGLRVVVVLSLHGGMTHGEIAGILRTRPGAVASRLRTARQIMRQALTGAEPDAVIVGE